MPKPDYYSSRGDFNHVVMLGTIVRDPELHYGANGVPFCTLEIVTNHEYRDVSNKKIQDACFIGVLIWGTRAEAVKEYKKKKDRVLVVGRIIQRQWETAEGQKRYRHEVVADTVLFQPKKGSRGDPEDAGPDVGRTELDESEGPAF